MDKAKLSDLRALAAFAGVDVHGQTNAKMFAQTFSTILSSTTFTKELMKTKLNFGNTYSTISLYDFCTKRNASNVVVRFIKAIPWQLESTLKKVKKIK